MTEDQKIQVLTDADIGGLLPKRRKDSNKGTYGRALCIAGSRNMAGAALLCAKAALRSGCGMVKILTPECNRVIVQSSFPEALLSTYDKEGNAPHLTADLNWADAVLIGPGIGKSEVARKLLSAVLDRDDLPLVLDADALNLLAGDPDILKNPMRGNVLITPHMAEMSRLTGESIGALKKDPDGAAADFARTVGVCCLLKDATSYAASPDGRIAKNTSGNDGMSTAGSGDVLAGICVSLLAQGMRVFDAAVLGAYLHGRAGDFAAAKKTKRAMIAGDLIDHLSDVFALEEL